MVVHFCKPCPVTAVDRQGEQSELVRQVRQTTATKYTAPIPLITRCCLVLSHKHVINGTCDSSSRNTLPRLRYTTDDDTWKAVIVLEPWSRQTADHNETTSANILLPGPSFHPFNSEKSNEAELIPCWGGAPGKQSVYLHGVLLLITSLR